MQVQYRCGFSAVGPAAPTRCQVGVAAVPFVVRKTMPLRCPTQMTSESDGATAIALMGDPALGLIGAHRGPDVGVLALFASLVRHSCSPPARRRFGSFGSSTNGAMNRAFCDFASGIWNGTGFQSHCPVAWLKNCPLMYRSPLVSSVVPPSVLRWMFRNTYSP